jgi:hypothetical protein
VGALAARLDRLEEGMRALLRQASAQQWYTTAEAACALGKAEYTVREWARLGRIRAAKRQRGHGRSREWIISAAELERIRREGFLPPAGPGRTPGLSLTPGGREWAGNGNCA